ncbi:MAG: hypothetical protein EF813_02180 [Methanosarcinales archaeon]|nr:MAG: hypothetical protein EF813_02180 [Methanosarcinales archaeon]
MFVARTLSNLHRLPPPMRAVRAQSKASPGGGGICGVVWVDAPPVGCGSDGGVGAGSGVCAGGRRRVVVGTPLTITKTQQILQPSSQRPSGYF